MEKTVHFGIGGFAITALRNNFMGPTIPYTFVPFMLMIPPGRSYTSFEKLFMPYKVYVWTVIGIIFVVGMISIILLRYSNKTLKDLVLGRENKSPILNMLNSSMGGSLAVLPNRNFARFLLMVWILFTLIMRSVYQGELFKSMKLKDHKHPIDSILKLIQKDFKFYMTMTTAEHVKNLQIAEK